VVSCAVVAFAAMDCVGDGWNDDGTTRVYPRTPTPTRAHVRTQMPRSASHTPPWRARTCRYLPPRRTRRGGIASPWIYTRVYTPRRSRPGTRRAQSRATPCPRSTTMTTTRRRTTTRRAREIADDDASTSLASRARTARDASTRRHPYFAVATLRDAV